MRYPAIITKDGKKTLATFPDCPGCQTEADPREDISIQAADALTGWLEAHLLLGRVPPQPSTRKPRGRVLWIEVPAGLAVKLLIRWARNEAGLTQEKVASALGARLEVNLAQDAA